MKKYYLILLVTLLFVSCAAQKPQGLYYDEKSGSFACIHHDSIAIGYKRNPSEKLLIYYYGNFTLTQGKVTLNKNILRYENMAIEEEFTDYSGIEIQLYEQQPFLALGAPTKDDSTFFQLANNCEVYLEFDSLYRNIFSKKGQLNALTTDNGLIQIPIATLLTMDRNNMVEFVIIGCTNFFSEVKISIIPHTRYIIKQKSLYHRPMVPQEVPIKYNSEENQVEITENSTINNQPYRTFKLKHIGQTESCLGDLLKRYPDL